MLSATSGTLHAYYPYNSSVTNIQDVPVEAASLTDYMYATTVSGLSVSSNEAQVTINHALTAIKLTLTRGTYSGTGKVTNLSVTSDALATAASLDATTGELSSITGAGTALAHDTDMTLEESAQSTVVTAVPTSATATVNITATVDGKVFAVTTSSTAFRQGNMYEYSLTVNNEAMTVADVNVTPWNSVDNGQLDYEAYDPFKNAIVATYYVDEAATATEIQILYGSFNYGDGVISKMEVDGVETTPSRTYKFSTPGEHIVKFLMKDETNVPDNMFQNNGVDKIKLPNSTKTIGQAAFMGCSGLTGTLTIPNSVTEIGEFAFYNCTGLTRLELGRGVKTIKKWAFRECTQLTGTLVIPNSVTTIEEYAFYKCSGLTGTLTIPEGMTAIGNNAFFYCSGLTGTLTIPEGMTTIGNSAFLGCSGFSAIVVNAGNAVYDSRNNCNAIMETATNTLVVGCNNTVIPSDCKTIGDGAFAYCSGLMGTLTIPNSVTTIGTNAFTDCTGLTEVVIPDGVTTIKNWAFCNCLGLTSIISYSMAAPAIYVNTFNSIKTDGILTVPTGATGYSAWMSASSYYLGYYNWTLQYSDDLITE